VACDVAQSGLGDRVHVCDGREAALALTEPFVPVDATIVGHVEQFAHGPPGRRRADA
jgi:microcompartment protein CcmK/EutM